MDVISNPPWPSLNIASVFVPTDALVGNPNPTSTSVGPTLSNLPSTTSTSSASNAGAIAGGVVGGIVGFAAIAAVLFFCFRRGRERPTPSSPRELTGVIGWTAVKKDHDWEENDPVIPAIRYLEEDPVDVPEQSTNRTHDNLGGQDVDVRQSLRREALRPSANLQRDY